MTCLDTLDNLIGFGVGMVCGLVLSSMNKPQCLFLQTKFCKTKPNHPVLSYMGQTKTLKDVWLLSGEKADGKAQNCLDNPGIGLF